MILVSGLFFILIFEILQAVLHAQMRAAYSLGYGYLGPLKSCAILLVTFPFATFIHEFGHFAAGRACRQVCLNFTIGPVEFAPQNGRWKPRLVVPHRAFVRLVPSTFDGFRLQRILCSAAGPAASAVAAPVFLFLAMHARSAMAYWVWSFAVQWALVGLASLAPIRIGATRSDGYHLWEAIRGGTALDLTMRDLLTPASHATPLRVGDWPHDLVTRIVPRAHDPANKKFNFYLNYIHFLDRGDVGTAGKFLDQFLALWTPSDPPEHALEAAYFLGFRRNDADAAFAWLEKETRDAEPWVRLRARAAAERAAGHSEACRSIAAEALLQLRAQPPCGAYQFEMDRLAEML